MNRHVLRESSNGPVDEGTLQTGWEIKQRSVIDMAADRGTYLDQPQSLSHQTPSPRPQQRRPGGSPAHSIGPQAAEQQQHHHRTASGAASTAAAAAVAAAATDGHGKHDPQTKTVNVAASLHCE